MERIIQTKNDEIVYAEIDAILNLMDEKYINRIPQKLKNIFKEEKSLDYKPVIDTKKALNEQKLQKGTMIILAMLCLNYWCDSEEEKQELIKAYSENERKNEAEIREKYNPDNLFKKRNEIPADTQMIEYHEGVLTKIWNKIKSLFHRR
ncbi:MAG: hypothetical protein J6N78_03120 [Clostridia bacterium]|nr:hypothetical protein [Clostridia bacterium]